MDEEFKFYQLLTDLRRINDHIWSFVNEEAKKLYKEKREDVPKVKVDKRLLKLSNEISRLIDIYSGTRSITSVLDLEKTINFYESDSGTVILDPE